MQVNSISRGKQNKLSSILFLLISASLVVLLLIDNFRLASGQVASSFESGRLSALANDDSSTPSENSTASLVWQPLRATFRPLNRSPPAPPEPLALVSNGAFDSPSTVTESTSGRLATSAASERSFFVPIITTAAPSTSVTSAISSPEVTVISVTPSPAPNLDDEDQPTRVPLNRFRPTKPPSVDTQSQPTNANLFLGPNSVSQLNNNNNNNNTAYRITNECFECICEASTSCNVQSRCQTSDVRRTRCGMFLISYDQWLETGLSKQLVNREALLRDAAADERAFYECVTKRDCAERLMSIYMQRKSKDCDKDGRFDCYDVAAIHQGGVDQCNSESFLESQYWSDFNACFGFGRRRR